jgi:hypothetical protein
VRIRNGKICGDEDENSDKFDGGAPAADENMMSENDDLNPQSIMRSLFDLARDPNEPDFILRRRGTETRVFLDP